MAGPFFPSNPSHDGATAGGLLNFSISGPEANEMPLTVFGPIPFSGSMDLFTQGPEANSLTLWIGKEINASGDISLYLEVPFSTGDPGTTLIQGQTPLSVSGDLYYNSNTQAPLWVGAPSIGSGIGNITLYAETDPVPEDGFFLGSGQMTIAVSGSDPAEVGTGQSNQTTLFIRVEDAHTSGLPMYIERPIAASIPLSISSRIVSGVLPIAISGMTIDTSDMSLHIQAPATTILTTSIKGYLE